MIQTGQSFGYEITPNGNVNENFVEYRSNFNDPPVFQMPVDEAKTLLDIMMNFFGKQDVNKLSDDELMSELKKRGYTGKLTKEVEL